MLAGNRRGERGALVEAAAAGRGRQVPRSGPGRRRAGRRRLGQAAAGRAELRRRPGDGLCRRFDLALVDAAAIESAFKRFWRQIVLWLAKKDQAQEGSVWIRLAERRLAPSQRVEFSVGANSPTRRAGRRRRLQGRDRLARRRPPAAAAGPSGRADGRLVPRHADAPATTPSKSPPRRKTSRWARPGRGSSSSGRTWNWTTPRPTPPRWRASPP